jgi:hypothetical protein
MVVKSHRRLDEEVIGILWAPILHAVLRFFAISTRPLVHDNVDHHVSLAWLLLLQDL